MNGKVLILNALFIFDSAPCSSGCLRHAVCCRLRERERRIGGDRSRDNGATNENCVPYMSPGSRFRRIRDRDGKSGCWEISQVSTFADDQRVFRGYSHKRGNKKCNFAD